MKNIKLWVVIKVKPEFSRFGIPETVGYFYNPYNKPVSYWVKFWIEPEFRTQVYGYKVH